MQFSLLINQDKALEWGLNAQQAMLFAFLYEVPSWARPTEKGGVIYYHISKGKVVDELPLLTDKPDTVYRLMKQLEEKGVVSLTSSGPFTLMAITEQGKTWNRDDILPRKNLRPNSSAKEGQLPRKNIRPKRELTSDKSPTNLGEKSDLTSDKSPTDHITRSDNQSVKYKNFDFSRWPAMPEQEVLDDWFRSRKRLKAEVTQTAINRMAGKLVECQSAGYSVNLCLSEAVLRGWKAVELEWLTNAKIKPDLQRGGAALAVPPQNQEQIRNLSGKLQDIHSEIKTLERLGQHVPDELMARQASLRQQLSNLRGGS